MKKIRRNSKKGFTLVELIVVLVILAILAAMLVPALTGYIDRAKKEKDYQAASVVYAAAQATLTEAYGNGKIDKPASGTAKLDDDTVVSAATSGNTAMDNVLNLAGITSSRLKDFQFTYDTNLVITQGWVELVDENSTTIRYNLNADGSWSRGTAAT